MPIKSTALLGYYIIVKLHIQYKYLVLEDICNDRL